MKLTEQQLLNLSTYINTLNEQVGLNDKTVHDVRCAIGVKLRLIKSEKND